MGKVATDLTHLASKMFYVWEGNHRLMAWWRNIYKHHLLDKNWHSPLTVLSWIQEIAP